MSRRQIGIIVTGCVVAIATFLWMSNMEPPERGPDVEPAAKGDTRTGSAATFTSAPDGASGSISAIAPKPATEEEVALTAVERHKQIDRKNMTAIYGGLKAFHAKHGRYPDYLSELVPDFIPMEALVSPRKESDGANRLLARDHVDPGLEKASYGYEYSNFEAYGDRTFQEIKDQQRAEWGEVVPVLRAFGYDRVINMNWAGELYETGVMWEHAESTLDLIDKYGWGPGIDAAGNSVEVAVTDEAGNPVSGAQVWAGGRSYTFPLPERPFVTNADGVANIPVGPDASSAHLGLRLSADGQATEAIQFDRGAQPGRVELQTQTAQTVAGQLLDNDGNPVPNTRVVLSGPPDENGVAAFIDYAKTDSQGNWTADVLPAEAEGVTARIRFRH